MASISLALGLLYALHRLKIEPTIHLPQLVTAYAVLHLLKLLIQFKKFESLPALPSEDIDASEMEGILARRAEMEAFGALEASVLKSYIPEVLAGLGDSDRGVREAAKKVSALLGPPVLNSIQVALIEHPIEDVRVHALTHAVGFAQLDSEALHAWCTSFARSAGGTLYALARASSSLDRHARIRRQDDAEAGEAQQAAARSLQLLAAALVHTLRGEEVRVLQRSKRGREALAMAVQQRCKLITAQPSAQQAMQAQWRGLQLNFDVIFISALAYSALAMLFLVTLLATPELLGDSRPAAILAAVPRWGRFGMLFGLSPAALLFLFLTKSFARSGRWVLICFSSVRRAPLPTQPSHLCWWCRPWCYSSWRVPLNRFRAG